MNIIMAMCLIILWAFYIEATIAIQERDAFHWGVGGVHLLTTVLTVMAWFTTPRVSVALLAAPLLWMGVLAIALWSIIWEGPRYVTLFKVDYPSVRDWILAGATTVYVIVSIVMMVKVL